MTFPPIPCAHCGTNFMRRDLNPESPKLCNTCELKEKNKPKPKEKNMTEVQMLITIDRKTQIEIEEHCVNHGISISTYVMTLHRTFGKLKDLEKDLDHRVRNSLPQDMKKFHDKFESLAQKSSVPPTEKKPKGGKK